MTLKNKIYVGLLAILLALKFILVPVIDWQEDLHINTSALIKQYAKYLSVVNFEDEIKLADAEIKQQLEQLNTEIPAVEDRPVFLLEKQQWLESILEKHKIKINNFGWQAPIYLTNELYSYSPVDIRISGRMLDLMNAVFELEQASKGVFVKDLQIMFSTSSDDKLGNIFGLITIHILSQGGG